MLIHDGILLQLIDCKMITEEEIHQFLKENHISIYDDITVVSLLQRGRISDEQVAQCMSILMKVSYVNLRFIEISLKHTTLISSDVANFLRCIPFVNTHGELHIAVEDPKDERTVGSIRHFFDDTPLAISTKSGMEYALQKYYPTKGYTHMLPQNHLSQLKKKTGSKMKNLHLASGEDPSVQAHFELN